MHKKKVSIVADLSTFVQSKEGVPFLWGYNDCCCFAADWVALRTGVDPMENLRGLTSEFSALRRLQSLGGVIPAVSSFLGETVAKPAVGSVVLYKGVAGSQTLGVCLGERCVLPGLDGPVFVESNLVSAAWLVC